MNAPVTQTDMRTQTNEKGTIERPEQGRENG